MCVHCVMCVCGCKHVCHGMCGGQMIAFFGELVLSFHCGTTYDLSIELRSSGFCGKCFCPPSHLTIVLSYSLHLNIHFPNMVCERDYPLPLNILVHLLKSYDSIYTDFFLDPALSFGPFVYPMDVCAVLVTASFKD